MSDPSLDLQKAIVGVLRADGAVAAFTGTRVYDRVPPSPTFPYISYGSDQVLQDDPGDPAECGLGYEVFITLDVWSRAVGQPEMKRVAGAVRAALHGEDFDLDEHRLVSLEHSDTRYLDDPDGLTHHGVLIFRAFVDGLDESGGS